MKKILTIATVAAMAVVLSFNAQGQGFITFGNSSAAASKISTNSIVGGASAGLTGVAANGYYYALFFSIAGTSVSGKTTSTAGTNGFYAFNDGAWSFSNDYATNAAVAGRVFGQQNADQSSTVTGVSGGNSAQFVVIGWSQNIGSTWQSVQSYLAAPSFTGWVGESAVSVPVTIGDGNLVSPPTILAASGAVPGFLLGRVDAVPEPSTLALAGLGGLATLLFRRRNKK